MPWRGDTAGAAAVWRSARSDWGWQSCSKERRAPNQGWTSALGCRPGAQSGRGSGRARPALGGQLRTIMCVSSTAGHSRLPLLRVHLPAQGTPAPSAPRPHPSPRPRTPTAACVTLAVPLRFWPLATRSTPGPPGRGSWNTCQSWCGRPNAATSRGRSWEPTSSARRRQLSSWQDQVCRSVCSCACARARAALSRGRVTVNLLYLDPTLPRPRPCAPRRPPRPRPLDPPRPRGRRRRGLPGATPSWAAAPAVACSVPTAPSSGYAFTTIVQSPLAISSASSSRVRCRKEHCGAGQSAVSAPGNTTRPISTATRPEPAAPTTTPTHRGRLASAPERERATKRLARLARDRVLQRIPAGHKGLVGRDQKGRAGASATATVLGRRSLARPEAGDDVHPKLLLARLGRLHVRERTARCDRDG